MSNNSARPLQSSLAELMGTVAMTFIGMTLMAPLLAPAPPIIGAATAVISTTIGAFAVIRSVKSGALRWMCLLIGVPLTWIASFFLIILFHEPFEFFVILGFFTIPALLGVVIGWFRNRSRNLSGQDFVMFILGHAFFSCIVTYGIAAMILPHLLRTRCPGCATAAAAACKAFAEAEEIYHRTDYNGDGVLEYCSKMTGATSLATNNGVEIALIDRAFAAAEGPNGTPKAGYLFRILTAQRLPVARSYIDSDGRMTKGYALIAYPVWYDHTGRDCFMISNAGTIYQADLGPNTTQIVQAMTKFDPVSPTWTPTE